MTTTTWTLRHPGEPVVEETLRLREPTGDLVRVRVTASGVCRSDLHAYVGEWTTPSPIVLGHEGAGVVEAVGEGVRSTRPGDRVALSWYASCGRCRHSRTGRARLCTATSSMDHRLPDGNTALTDADDAEVHSFLGLGTFAESVVVPESAVVVGTGGVGQAIVLGLRLVGADHAFEAVGRPPNEVDQAFADLRAAEGLRTILSAEATST